MGKKRGRSKKSGERYACGKLKPTGEPVAPAVWDRIRKDAVKLCGDARLSSEVGRLSLHKELSSPQTAAAFKVAEIYGAFERYKGKRRSIRSPSYEAGFGGDGGLAEELMSPQAMESLEERIRAAENAWLALQQEIPEFPRDMRRLLEDLCVEDRAINPMRLEDVRAILDRLARYFGITSSSSRNATRQKGKAKSPAAKPEPKRVDVEKMAFSTVLAKLRPDLSPDEIAQAFDLSRAIKDRAIVRRANERKQGNVVYLPPMR